MEAADREAARFGSEQDLLDKLGEKLDAKSDQVDAKISKFHKDLKRQEKEQIERMKELGDDSRQATDQERQSTLVSIQVTLLKKLSTVEQSLALKLGELDSLDLEEVKKTVETLKLEQTKATQRIGLLDKNPRNRLDPESIDRLYSDIENLKDQVKKALKWETSFTAMKESQNGIRETLDKVRRDDIVKLSTQLQRLETKAAYEPPYQQIQQDLELLKVLHQKLEERVVPKLGKIGDFEAQMRDMRLSAGQSSSTSDLNLRHTIQRLDTLIDNQRVEMTALEQRVLGGTEIDGKPL